MKIEFDFDPDDFKKEAIKEAKKGIERSIKSIVCEEHGETPRIKWKSSGSFDSEIFGCCEDIQERAMSKIQNR